MDRQDITMETREKIKANLKKYDFEYTSLHVPALQKASVLIPLFVKKGELHTLMTLRSVKLKTGAGEVCFPGGKHDSQDRDEIDTALREAEEEIGLLPHEVDVVGRLFPVMTKGGILVTPVVAFIEDTFQAHPSPEEVSSVFSVPLRHFLSSTQHSSCHIPGVNIKLHNFSYLDPDSQKEYHIWGLTALLAILIAVLALQKKPEFEVDFDTEDPVSHFRHTLHLQISKL